MKTILVILAIVMMAAVPASAQIPRLINYQGVLTDDMGVVVSDGSYSMTFRLYEEPSGGTQLWEETIDVNVSKGIFNTTLGHDVVITEFFDKPLYLSIEIDGGGELSPRRIFTANAYAFSTRAVYGVSNVFPAEGNVGIGIIAPAPEAPLHIYTDITDPNTPALLIQNEGTHSIIDFKRNSNTEARIRMSSGSNFYFGTLTTGGVSFRTNDLNRMSIAGDGRVAIGSGFSEKLAVDGAINLGTTTESNAGTLRWTGSDFEGYDGSLWHSLTSGGGSSLPSGSAGQTLLHNGTDWAAATNLYNNGTSIGIGTVAPTSPLHVVYSAGQVALQVDSDDGSWASIYINASNPTGKPYYGYQKQNATVGGHYLDSALNWNLKLDGNPALIVQPNGWASFGSVAVYESLNIPGALKLGMNSNNNAGTIRWTGSDFEGYDGGSWNSFTSSGLPAGSTGQTLRYNGDWVAAGNLYNSGTDIGIGTTSPVTNLHIYENVNGIMGIQIENPNTGSGSGEQIAFVDENGTVAGIRFYDDTAVSTYAGSMAIYNNRPSGSILFRTGGVDRMKILESGVLSVIGTGGNASVGLPTDAVSAPEILDEPGTASSTSNTSTLISTTATVLLSRTITVPDDGYVFVIGTTQAQIGHSVGTSSTLNVGVSNSASVLPVNQDVGWLIPPGSSTATYTLPITVQGLFEVSAGSNSFYLLGLSATATATMYGLDKQLTLIYIPTNYGTVMPTLVSSSLADSDVPTDRGMSSGDLSAERAASEAVNNDRIERELAAMRDRIATLENELGNK